jgi:predicted DNA-binding transcriptional regulator AlpA
MQTKEVQSEFYTMRDMQRLFGGVSRWTIRRWEQSGKLPKRSKFGVWCRVKIDQHVAKCCNRVQMGANDDFSR